MAKLYFQQALRFSFHCDMILHKLLEHADLGLKKHFVLSMLKTIVLLNILWESFWSY